MNQRREENDQIICSALRRYAQEESSGLPSAEELSGVTFTKALKSAKGKSSVPRAAQPA